MGSHRAGAAGALLLVLAMVAGACGSSSKSSSSSGSNTSSTVAAQPKQSITIASANFSENVMLADMYAAVLQNAGYPISTKLNLGAREVIEPALENGQIDFIPEYAGNYLSFLDKTAPSLDVDTTVTRLRSSVYSRGRC